MKEKGDRHYFLSVGRGKYLPLTTFPEKEVWLHVAGRSPPNAEKETLSTP